MQASFGSDFGRKSGITVLRYLLVGGLDWKFGFGLEPLAFVEGQIAGSLA